MRRTSVGAAVAGVALCGQVLWAIPATAAGAPVRQVRTSAGVALSDAATTPTTVERITLPKGSWTVTGDVTAINLGQGDFVRCQLLANGSPIDGGQDVYLQGRVGGLVDVGTVVARAAVTVAVSCDHDFPAQTPGQLSAQAGATLTAVEGGPIRAPGITATGSPTVVQSRTTSAVTLARNAYSAVTSISLPKGSWAVTANASAFNFSTDFAAFDFASCLVVGGKGTTITSNFASAGTDEIDALSTGLDVEAVASVTGATGSVILRCASDFSTTVSIESGATLTATKAPTTRQAFVSEVPLAAGAGVATVVAQTTVPAGPWRVRSELAVGNRLPNNSYGAATDSVRCGLLANGQPIDGGATELVTDASNYQVVVDAGSFTAASPWTLSLSCSHDAANTSGGTWTVLDGSIVGVDRGPIG